MCAFGVSSGSGSGPMTAPDLRLLSTRRFGPHPAGGFYEWKKEGGAKLPFAIVPGDAGLTVMVRGDKMTGTDTGEATGMATEQSVPGEKRREPQMLGMNGYRYAVATAFALIATSTSNARSVEYSFIVKNNICSFPQAGEEPCNSTIMRLNRTNGEIIEFTANYRTGAGSPKLTSMQCSKTRTATALGSGAPFDFVPTWSLAVPTPPTIPLYGTWTFSAQTGDVEYCTNTLPMSCLNNVKSNLACK